jgi:hypothetical protein
MVDVHDLGSRLFLTLTLVAVAALVSSYRQFYQSADKPASNDSPG